jgi:hypothetical protein
MFEDSSGKFRVVATAIAVPEIVVGEPPAGVIEAT